MTTPAYYVTTSGNSTALPVGVTWDDATWILTNSFIIFTMQTGFGMLEAGAVSLKNEVNIMVKNAVDVIYGGLSYWTFGYAFSFGEDSGSNPFIGIGYFFVDSSDPNELGILFATFVFQLSFATTATTIASGMMAERTKLFSYSLFSFFNTLVYCVPAHWVWGSNGFLSELGVIDIAGSGAVHLLGAVSGLVATILLKPRIGRYDNIDDEPPIGNGTNSILGMFILWWGWLSFNCGSTFGISGGKWKLAAKAAATTLIAAMGGGFAGCTYSQIRTKGKLQIGDLVNSVLGALVGITAGCAIVKPWEALIIGIIAGMLTLGTIILLDKMKIDDPVGGFGVHGVGGVWGMLAVGLFAENDTLENMTKGQSGLFRGGGFRLLGVQLLACVCIAAWSALSTLAILLPLKYTLGIRLSKDHERLGSDYVEHGIDHHQPTGMMFIGNRVASEPAVYARRGSRVSNADSKKGSDWNIRRSNKIAEANKNIKNDDEDYISTIGDENMTKVPIDHPSAVVSSPRQRSAAKELAKRLSIKEPEPSISSIFGSDAELIPGGVDNKT
ncbi:unnamed protein product [Owenia fusiformis]|uniref:Ammonium transporter n=1 Tax=Owenia fusiformis TaxID=6347 RepID=A0A8J1URU2_OWEFU|nr:unnamed protein product [Owenia fusiformis]